MQTLKGLINPATQTATDVNQLKKQQINSTKKIKAGPTGIKAKLHNEFVGQSSEFYFIRASSYHLSNKRFPGIFPLWNSTQSMENSGEF